jgi:ribosomal-protein-alanine N-acetyltransferase
MMTENLEPLCFDALRARILPEPIATRWTEAVPAVADSRLTLRELVPTDSAALLSMLSTEEVAKFISPPPTTERGFQNFITWTRRERQAGRQITFGIVPDGCETAVGLVQVRSIAPNFAAAEWGFALGSPYWGTGLFLASARMTLDFAFRNTSVNRLEARAVVANSRGNGALRKLGAVSEGVLRGSMLKDGKYLDQIMWSIVRQDWYHAKAVWSSAVH